MTKRADRKTDDRCRRTGSNWRCPEKPLPDKIYCEKHYSYSVSRNNRRKVQKSSAVKCNSSVVSVSASASASATAAVVEPYRPVIDFGATEVGGGGNVEGLVNEGELMGWLLGDNGWNDQFASCGSRGGGGNDDFTLGRESGDGS